MSDDAESLHREMRKLGLVILLGVVVLFGTATAWATVAKVDTAVVSTGEIRPGQSRLVQEVESGRIGELLARDGDAVTAGQTLFVLQDDGRRAEFDLLTLTHHELLVRRAYLKARVNESTRLVLPRSLIEAASRDPLRSIVGEYRAMLEQDDDTLGSTRRVIQKRLDVQESSTSRIADQIEALESSIAANKEKLGGLDPKKPLDALEISAVEGTVEGLEAQLKSVTEASDSSEGAEEELRAQLTAEQDQAAGEIQSEIASVEADLAEVVVQRDQARQEIRRLTVRAPITGIVHEVRPLAEGDVVAPGQPTMEVIPAAEDRIASVRIPSADVDAVEKGQSVAIKLSAFAPGTVPDLIGTTTEVASAPDVDPETGNSTYLVQVRIKASDLARLPDSKRVVAGMPVEAFFNVGETRVLSYLVSPLLDQIRRSAPG